MSLEQNMHFNDAHGMCTHTHNRHTDTLSPTHGQPTTRVQPCQGCHVTAESKLFISSPEGIVTAQRKCQPSKYRPDLTTHHSGHPTDRPPPLPCMATTPCTTLACWSTGLTNRMVSSLECLCVCVYVCVWEGYLCVCLCVCVC